MQWTIVRVASENEFIWVIKRDGISRKWTHRFVFVENFPQNRRKGFECVNQLRHRQIFQITENEKNINDLVSAVMCVYPNIPWRICISYMSYDR